MSEILPAEQSKESLPYSEDGLVWVQRRRFSARRLRDYLFNLDEPETVDELSQTDPTHDIPRHVAALAISLLAVGVDFSDLSDSDNNPTYRQIIVRTAKTNRDRVKILAKLPSERPRIFGKRY